MKQFTVTIPDNKMNLFVEMMGSISYVEKVEEICAIEIPEEHMAMVRERIEKYKDNPESYLEGDEIESKIKLGNEV